MNCQIEKKFFGCSVIIETRTLTVKGLVRSVDANGSKLVLQNPVAVSCNSPLPTLYNVFAKEVIKIDVVEAGVIKPPEVPVKHVPIKRSTPPRKPFPQVPSVPQVPSWPQDSPSSQVYPIPQVSPPKINSSIKNRTLLQHKNLPTHIKHLNNDIETEVLVNKVPQIRNGKEVLQLDLPPYSLIDSIDEEFHDVVKSLLYEGLVGVSMEGVDVSRDGIICWIAVSFGGKVVLFDMCSLGPPAMKKGLADFFTNPSILKVVHDCRFMSDALFHQYGVKMENVFDTQVAASIDFFNKHGTFNKFVLPLTRCLAEIMNFPKEKIFHSRTRVHHEKEDDDKWRERPAPKHLIEGAVFNVCHLKTLRKVLMEALLSPVTQGTNLYLKEITALPDDELPGKKAHSHCIPLSFATLVPRHMRNDREFRPNVSKDSCDPYLTFTRNIPHVAKP